MLEKMAHQQKFGMSFIKTSANAYLVEWIKG